MQFPQWSRLPIAPVPSDGTDNALYRIGDALVTRLPLIEWAVPQVEKDHQWLPLLQPHLPVRVPEPVAKGRPGSGYPWPWAIHRWLDGYNPTMGSLDAAWLVDDLAGFIAALRACSFADPPRSARAGGLAPSDAVVRSAIRELENDFDADALTAIWDAALAAEHWPGAPVPVHGDLSDGNVLAADGRITAVIDWSLFGWGDRALDLSIGWDLLDRGQRRALREALETDEPTWRRAKGWAVHSVVGLTYYRESNPGIVTRCVRRLREVIDEAG